MTNPRRPHGQAFNPFNRGIAHAHILASAGLLDGHPATTFHGAFGNFARQFPKVDLVRDQRWVDSGRVVTSAGLSSGIDASLYLVSQLHDEQRARSVALHLEYPWDPAGGFVRGRMLDLQAPRLAGVAWPEGTSFQSLYSVGDSHAWHRDIQGKRRQLVFETAPMGEAGKFFIAYKMK